MEQAMKVLFVPISQNAKTGPIPASIVERASCWPGCALYENGCYAETGALAMHWDRESRGSAGGSWSEFCAKVAAFWPGRLWRYAQAGDLPGCGAKIDTRLLEELVIANTGKKAIAFTHKPVLGNDPVAVENRQVIAQAIKAGFTINLSTDNPAHADRLAELGIAPVVTVLARAYARRAVRHRFKRRRDEWAETIGEWRDRTASLPRHTPAGRRIAICPATYSEATCKTCGCVRPGSGRRDRLPRSWCLAVSRGRDGRQRGPSRTKLGFPGSSHYGRSDRSRSRLANNPRQQQLAGVLASSRRSCHSPNPELVVEVEAEQCIVRSYPTG
jgi:hypothetical protein